MTIELKKFGTTLISRQTGKEAYLACKSLLRDVRAGEEVILDFEGVHTFSPSWGDEFLTPLLEGYGQGLELKNTENLSVKATLGILEEIHKKKFNVL